MFSVSVFSISVWSSTTSEEERTTLGGWALIAEATDDIGNGFAHELAQRGINIVLVVGDEIKLKKLAAELNIKYDVHLRSPSLLSAA